MKWHRRGRKWWQSRREQFLDRQGFLAFERRELKTLTFKDSPWFRKIRRQRAKELRALRERAVAERWSQAKLNRIWVEHIRGRYADSGWLLADGTPDAWRMFRAKRAEAIRRGEWVDTPDRGSRRRIRKDPTTGLSYRIDKGQFREQAARYRERKRREKAGVR